MLRGELIERGLDAVGYLSIGDAIDALPQRRPDLIVIELRGQTPATLEPLFRIGVPVIAIAGANDSESSLPFTAVMRRPVSIGEIAQRVLATLTPR